MSLVDQYHDRVFRNGRLYGVNYNEMTNQPTYTDISPFGGGRKAGQGIGLEPDVVIYMGKAAQGMPQDESMDKRIAEGFMKAIGQLFRSDNSTMNYVPDRDRAENRTMEYIESRDGPATPEKLGPYNPDTDKSEFIQLLAGSPSFDLTYPRGRRGDNFEGIPNANDPVMREKLRNRRLRNPAGKEDLPGFLGTV